MSPEYEKGFNDGIEWCQNNFDVKTGILKLPESFIHRSGSYNCGMGEGFITGRHEMLRKHYGEYKSLQLSPNHDPIIEI